MKTEIKNLMISKCKDITKRTINIIELTKTEDVVLQKIQIENNIKEIEYKINLLKELNK